MTLPSALLKTNAMRMSPAEHAGATIACVATVALTAKDPAATNVTGAGEGEADEEGEMLALGLTDAEGDGDGETDELGLTLADGDGERETLLEGLTDAEGETEGLTLLDPAAV